MIRVACVQENVVFDDPTANAAIAIGHLRDLRSEDVRLAIFPEAFLTGYCVNDFESALAIGISDQHAALTEIRRVCAELGIDAIVGFAERQDRLLYNSAAFIRSDDTVSIYRKTHLPELGLDRFALPGRSIDLVETEYGKVGVLICFDMRYPEATRTLSIAGADLICLPTNWPEGAECSADHISIARAAENRVFFAACNRVGEENGFRFIGRSKIVAPSGEVLTGSGHEPCVLVADLDFEQARSKRSVLIPGIYEVDVLGARRPDLYRLG